MNAVSLPALDSAALTRWLLVHGPRFESPRSFLEEYAAQLRLAGMPLLRVMFTFSQIHPVFRAITYEWLMGAPAREIPRRRDQMNSRAYSHSPIALAMRSRQPVRRRLTGPDAELDFPVLEELRDIGVTDYYVIPLDVGRPQEGGLITYNADAPDGFTAEQIALLDALVPALAVVGQVHAGRQSLQALMETYVGREPAERILAGEVVQGVGHTVRAIVWWCDLRDFTRLSEVLSRDEIMELLDVFFSATVESVDEAGGEVLKFMGDGVLAIFRCNDGDGDAAARALGAAHALIARLTALNDDAGRAEKTSLRCGVALHLGPVMYGNIGAPERLDFTVIGPTVNQASRLAQLCGPLDEPIVLSAEAAEAAGFEMRTLGRFGFKGLDSEREAFAPA
jgi:adenylate cyclase